MNYKYHLLLVIVLALFSCAKQKTKPVPGIMQIASIKVGTVYLDFTKTIEDVIIDNNILIKFNSPLDISTVHQNVFLKTESENIVTGNFQYNDANQTIVLTPTEQLKNNSIYKIEILSELKSETQETFPGLIVTFKTIASTLAISEILINTFDFSSNIPLHDIDYKNIKLEILFSEALDPNNYESFFNLSNNANISAKFSEDNKKITIQNTGNLSDLSRYNFTISPNLKSATGSIFAGFSKSFYTSLDSTYKFAQITDEELLELIQKQSFKYFWDFAHPNSGLIRDRNTSGDIVTISGTGFGIMAIIVAIEHGFISRDSGIERLEKITSFLETADRFHGAWPHWLNGLTGKVQAFSTKDNGGDLVETAFLVEGLLTFRQYLNAADTREKALQTKINNLWQAVEWNWYTQGGQNVLYWHWSPNYGWEMNHQIRGYNEALITYILARSSANYKIETSVFHQGYCKNGSIVNGNTYQGYKLPLGEAYGGPLFYEHYSFVALDPRNLKDAYANYWEQAVNHSLINWAYCNSNPKKNVGFSSDCWGLTASDNYQNYSAHSPTNDLGVISPTAAVSSLPFCPEQSMNAIRHFYYRLGDKVWGEYGFYDAFAPNENWWANSYLAIDQGPIILMIENYRTGLLWNLFMTCPEVTGALDDLGFTY